MKYFVIAVAAALLAVVVGQVRPAFATSPNDVPILQFDSTANAQRVVECEPDFSVEPITLATNAGGTASADVPAGRYQLIVAGEQSNVRTSANCTTTPATSAARTYVVGTQLPLTLTATTKFCGMSVGAQGKVQFAKCR